VFRWTFVLVLYITGDNVCYFGVVLCMSYLVFHRDLINYLRDNTSLLQYCSQLSRLLLLRLKLRSLHDVHDEHV